MELSYEAILMLATYSKLLTDGRTEGSERGGGGGIRLFTSFFTLQRTKEEAGSTEGEKGINFKMGGHLFVSLFPLKKKQ